ncbi:hypothetical protein [Sulfuricurvum sp.]|uniref:hypothetical protein n=1 Tax=Sulfuricurvum sp. TaxID=2025608 RepID=UPI002636212A|nr:hypothetical protein [Sulfuricurvum sp.]MDD4950247.1 hypothetical protein [Sulfuricurvum sp.]
MELRGNKIEFDLEEFMPLLISNKQEGFRLIGEKFLNALLEIASNISYPKNK